MVGPRVRRTATPPRGSIATPPLRGSDRSSQSSEELPDSGGRLRGMGFHTSPQRGTASTFRGNFRGGGSAPATPAAPSSGASVSSSPVRSIMPSEVRGRFRSHICNTPWSRSGGGTMKPTG
ncbi:hypothetical protein MRV_0123 [Murid herpesvirus 3]|uniref:Uncharacterized protein n=2 Tax=Murid betaherpesvirus 3 TaxID=2560603 RepID=A0A1P8VJ08_9BETA|nr:hypothetical protein MRV_0123 [Murine roseolovirus]APZ76334.1 hypothetical protein MRV_0123 [Murid betaherpesvirus 3]AYH64806.1 hypothetical protein MRV_0123 [Murid herpesvirus 3]